MAVIDQTSPSQTTQGPSEASLLLGFFECTINPSYFPELMVILENWLAQDEATSHINKFEGHTNRVWEMIAGHSIDTQPATTTVAPLAVISRHLTPKSGDTGIIENLHVDDAARLRAWIKSPTSNETILRFFDKNDQIRYVLAQGTSDDIALYAIQNDVGETVKSILKSSFNISNTEMSALEGLITGKSIADIAASLNKSVETIRSQIKSLSAKLGVSRQQDIVGLVHNIKSSVNDPTPANGADWVPQVKELTLPDGRQIGYRCYGDPKGKPVLYMHCYSSSNNLPRGAHDGFIKQGLRVIAPARAGYAASTPVLFEGPELVASHIKDYEEILAAEGITQTGILTLGSSVPIAYQFALKNPEKTIAVIGLDIFPPVTSRGAAMAYAKGLHRTGALAAFYAPSMLRLITRFVIRRSQQIDSIEQLNQMNGNSAEISEVERAYFEEFLAPNFHDVLISGGEGSWRDCTYFNFDWVQQKQSINTRPKFSILQHKDFPFVSNDYIQKFADENDADFLLINAQFLRGHQQMDGLAQEIASRLAR